MRLIYRDMALGLGDGKPPLLQDLYEELLKQPEPEARRVATALELYCTGSLNLFNHQTNVKLTSHIVCIVLKGLGENLRRRYYLRRQYGVFRTRQKISGGMRAS